MFASKINNIYFFKRKVGRWGLSPVLEEGHLWWLNLKWLPAFPSLITVGELDGLLSSQNSLIGRLKEECCNLGTKLEELAEKSRWVFPLCLNIYSLSYASIFFKFAVCFLAQWLFSLYMKQLFALPLCCLFPLSAGHPCHHFTKHHLSRLFEQSTSTYYILLSSLTCFLVNLMLQ